METLAFWKKLNTLVKSGTPMEEARRMLDRGDITRDEIAWALSALASLPIAMMDVLSKNRKK